MADLRRLLHYLRPYWPQMTVATAALLVSSLVVLALPWAVSMLIDAVFSTGDQQLLTQISVVLLALFVLQSLLYLVEIYLLAFVGQRVVADLRLATQRRLLDLPLRFYDDNRVGELVSRVTNDVAVMQTALTETPTAFLRVTVTFVGGLALMIVLNWQLTLFILVMLPPLMLIGVFFGRRLERLSTQVQDRLADATTVLEENISGIRVVKSFGREWFERGRFAAQVENVFATSMQRTRVRATFIPLISFMSMAALTAVVWFGGQQVLAGALTPGELVAFIFYMFMVAGPLAEFAGLYSQLREALGASHRFFAIIETPPEAAADDGTHDLPPVRGTVCFAAVAFSYDPANPVLHDIDLTAHPGEMIALVGPSGVGKTTLVNLLPRFYNITTGAITIDGIDIRTVQLGSLRSQIGLVPQETFLFGGTVRDNIAYGRLQATEAEISAAAQAANAHEFICNLPDGYATIVGERGVKLSAGQRQRIAIARALLKDPRILILDEATSALDTESERLVQSALERLMQGRTSFVIAHRLSTVQRADRIVVLQGGRIAETGRHHELLAQDGLYARLWSLQFGAQPEDGIAPLLA